MMSSCQHSGLQQQWQSHSREERPEVILVSNTDQDFIYKKELKKKELLLESQNEHRKEGVKQLPPN